MLLKKIQCFVCVARQGSFTAAARILHLSQPSLGEHIRALEERYGVVLFDRHARGVRLSPAGQRFLHQAETLLQEADRTEMALRALGGGNTGRLLLGITPTPQATLAPGLLQRCARDSPGIELVLSQGLSDDVRRLTALGQLDAALCYAPSGTAAQGLTPLYSEHLYLVGRAGALGRRRSVRFDELPAYKLTLERRTQVFRRHLDEVARREGLLLDVEHEVEPVDVKRALIRRHGAFTVVPYGLFFSEISNGEMGAWRIVSPSLQFTLHLALRPGLPDHLSALLIRWLGEGIREIIAAGELRWESCTDPG